MTATAKQIVTEIQSVLTRHNAALFFGPDFEGELWVDGSCAGHVTHGDDCELVEGTVCETVQRRTKKSRN